MKPSRLTVAICLLLAASALAAEKHPGGSEVLVVADLFAKADESFRPSPGKPVYYVISGKTEYALGEPMAGVPATDPSLIEREVVKAMASQGFVRTQAGGPMPSIAILIVWGSANFFDPSKVSDPDRAKMAQLAGSKKWGGPKMFGPPPLMSLELQQATLTTTEDRVYVSVSALDAVALREKVARLLWRTNMTIDGRNQLVDALPLMLASAAPFFGRGADEPVFVNDKARQAAKVEIGDLKVVPDDAKPGPGPAPKK